MPSPATSETPTATQTGDLDFLRAEMHELRVQCSELRQLKDFHEAQAKRWKEDARVAKEEAQGAKEELRKSQDVIVRRCGEMEKVATLLGLWEDKADALEAELRIAEAGKVAAEAEKAQVQQLLEEAEAAWSAETLVLEEEIRHMLDLDQAAEADAAQSVSQLRALLEGACTRLKLLPAMKKELAAAQAKISDLQVRLKEAETSNARQSQKEASTIAGLSAQLAESKKRVATLDGGLRASRVSVREYQLEIEKLKKALADGRKRSLDDVDIKDDIKPKRHRTCEGSGSINRKESDVLPEQKVRENMKRAFMACYKAVVDYRTPCERICSEPLRKLPEKAVNPRYLEVVNDPIANIASTDMPGVVECMKA